MTQALWRLLLICAAAAAGETIAYQVEAYGVMMWVGLAFGAAAYIFTQDLDSPRRGGGRRGEIKYWRGRRVDDDDDGPPRLN
ncbi:MAG: hypothetical protein ACRDG6_10655 [Candidatus Limnocylindria bacterium]